MAQAEQSMNEITAELPMLRRLEKEYEDAEFSPGEVNVFREECSKVRSGTNDPAALAALDKLIFACDEALKDKAGLIFYSD